MNDERHVDDATSEIPARRPPTGGEVRAAVRDAKTAVDAEAERLPRAVERIAKVQASRTAKRIGLIGVILTALLAVAISLVAYSNSADAQQRARTTQESVDTALGKLSAANDTLTARGQAPVPAPPAPTPADAITAAVLAQVLAQLPPTPTADQVASRLQASVTANILGPSLAELTGQVSAYFSAHPPIPGPAPSQEAIQAAVAAVYAANPPKDGAMGAQGIQGVPGVKGDPCSPSDPACVGPKGADSTVPGPEGPEGKQGPPVSSWTYTDALGGQHACTRDQGSPAEAPTYTCA